MLSKIVVSYKVFPKDVTIDLEALKKIIEKNLPSKASVYGFNVEPIAFGLNALVAHVIIPEDETGILDKVEQKLERIDEVSQIQTLTVRKTY